LIEMVASDPISSVCPSAGASAAACAAMTVLAPALFSTMNGWPSALLRYCDVTR